MRIHTIDAVWLKNGRVIDPFTGRDEIADVAIVDGIIAVAAPSDTPTLDATGLIICPGLMDLHVHLREPGQTHKETIESGTAAAAAGGFTFVACMPNTTPRIDQPDVVRSVRDTIRAVGHCDGGPVAAITVGLEGETLTDFAALREAGAVAFSDDGSGVDNDDIMLAAFEQAAKLDVLLMQHCEYRAMSAGGVMHLGETAKQLGFPGLDPRSEEAMMQRDIDLCRNTGGRYHVTHISTARGIELVRRAKAEGLPVTTEVTPHHLLLTDEACHEADPNTKMHPPLRPQADVEACRQGLLDGTIDCIATDHAPHTANEKAVGFRSAPPGIVGLETAVGAAAEAMIESGLADWPKLIGWFNKGPATVLRQVAHAIEPGAPADLALVNPESRWTVRPERFLSKSRNTPFSGRSFQGQPVGTVLGRRFQVHEDASLDPS